MKNKVFLAECEDYSKEKTATAVRRALDAFGGAAALAGGKRVLIKVNLLMAALPDKAVTTHPSVVEAIAREFISAGCKVEIADSCGGAYTEDVLRVLYATSGMKKVAEATGAELNYDVSSFECDIPQGIRLKKTQMITPVKRADFIVSAAKLKTHSFAYYTGAVKNLFGVIPGKLKTVMHSRFPEKKAFCEMLVDLCEAVKPDLAIIDGVYGMEGAGPSGGKPRFAGVLIASPSPYAADVAGMRVMGLDENKSYVHVNAKKRGLVSEPELEGDDISCFRTDFEPAYKREPRTSLAIIPGAVRRYVDHIFAKYPVVLEDKCIGCGECAKACPEETIEISGGRARVNRKKCIRCYCCQEMCPIVAIEIGKKHRGGQM